MDIELKFLILKHGLLSCIKTMNKNVRNIIKQFVSDLFHPIDIADIVESYLLLHEDIVQGLLEHTWNIIGYVDNKPSIRTCLCLIPEKHFFGQCGVLTLSWKSGNTFEHEIFTSQISVRDLWNWLLLDRTDLQTNFELKQEHDPNLRSYFDMLKQKLKQNLLSFTICKS
jgi:hypothetical protein